MIRSYSISGVSLEVECEDKWLSKKVIRVIEEYFFVKVNSSIPISHNITIRFKSSNILVEVPETAQELASSPSLRVLKNGESCYLIMENSIFRIDLVNSLCTGVIDPGFWGMSPKFQQEFLMLSLLWLLRTHEIYALHANALVKDKIGILLVGGTGSGKSTTTISLIRQGWSYLSDDVTLLMNNLERTEAVAFTTGFSVDSSLANHYPELNKPMETSSFNGQKRLLDISPIYGDRFLHNCIPKVVIFPKIVSQGKSQLMPIEKTMALIMLMKNSGGIMVNKQISAKQSAVIKRLVQQASTYQLLAGRDLYLNPEKITEVLSEIMLKA